ncbi:phage tail protein [Cochlodiniinecator piscidefendens]|uniref:hypothetical protein n=1 Tax=Cochlodiniinecator piscidefendens TaxID=2715756 RepID=UPI00140A8152|nr:hypothetical protein [Cochlodiniinecator piscidefendens]
MLNKPLAAARLQLGDLLAWATEEPHWTCDTVIDQATTVAEVLDLIAATGRARRTLRDLKYSVIRDGAAGLVVQQFGTRNTYGFIGRVTFPKPIHGFRVRVMSEAMEWQQDELVVYADGYGPDNATEFETLELPGVVITAQEFDGGNAWRLARYHMAQAILRPEEFEWKSDLDHLRCNMGDKVRVVHDVPIVGVGSARVVGVVNDEQITLDEPFDVEAGTYCLFLRIDRLEELRVLVEPVTTQRCFSWNIIGGDDVHSVQYDDLVLIKRMGEETLELLIASIHHSEDLQATLKGVPAAPEVFGRSR